MKLLKSAILIFILLLAVHVEGWCATKYLRNVGTTNWNVDASWSTNADGVDGDTTFPTLADDVVINAVASTTVLTVNVSSACNSLDMTGFTGSFALNQKFYIETVLTFSQNATYSTQNYDICYFYGGFDIYCNEATVNCTIGAFNDIIILKDNLNLGNGNLGVNTGSVITNNHNIICGKVFHTVTTSATITLGSSTVTCTSFDTSGTNLTFNYNTSTVIVNQAATGTMSFSHGTAQFYNLTLNGHDSVGCSKAFSGNLIVNNILTISGNSAVNKLALKSSDTTVRTITAPTVNLSNIDYYQNIKGAGDGWIGKVPFFNSASSWNPTMKYSGVLR